MPTILINRVNPQRLVEAYVGQFITFPIADYGYAIHRWVVLVFSIAGYGYAL